MSQVHARKVIKITFCRQPGSLSHAIKMSRRSYKYAWDFSLARQCKLPNQRNGNIERWRRIYESVNPVIIGLMNGLSHVGHQAIT